MKRSAPRHPKMLMLAAELNIPVYSAVGLMEMLWNWTAQYAPSGDLGRYSNSIISRAVEWEKDPDEFCAALVRLNWLEEVRTENAQETHKKRLAVHDWPDHADDSVHIALARSHSLFFDGTRPKLTRLSKDERTEIENSYKSLSDYEVANKRTINAQETHKKRTAKPSQAKPSLAQPSQCDLAAVGEILAEAGVGETAAREIRSDARATVDLVSKIVHRCRESGKGAGIMVNEIRAAMDRAEVSQKKELDRAESLKRKQADAAAEKKNAEGGRIEMDEKLNALTDEEFSRLSKTAIAEMPEKTRMMINGTTPRKSMVVRSAVYQKMIEEMMKMEKPHGPD